MRIVIFTLVVFLLCFCDNPTSSQDHSTIPVSLSDIKGLWAEVKWEDGFINQNNQYDRGKQVQIQPEDEAMYYLIEDSTIRYIEIGDCTYEEALYSYSLGNNRANLKSEDKSETSYANLSLRGDSLIFELITENDGRKFYTQSWLVKRVKAIPPSCK